MNIDIIEEIYKNPLVRNLPDVKIQSVNYNNAKLSDLKAEAQQMADIKQELNRISYSSNGLNQQSSILLYVIAICIVGYIIFRCCCTNNDVTPTHGFCRSLRCPGRRTRRVDDIEMQQHNSNDAHRDEPHYASVTRRIPVT